MSRKPPAATLARLHALADMKRQAELARLARIAASRARLTQAITSIRDQGARLETIHPDPALMRASLAHARWSEGQIRRLNQQLAMVSADYARLRPQVARAHGRAEVLETLRDQAENAARLASARRYETP